MERIERILAKKSISKMDGKTLAKWYKKETGIDKESCMCSSSQREEIRVIVGDYLKTKGKQ